MNMQRTAAFAAAIVGFGLTLGGIVAAAQGADEAKSGAAAPAAHSHLRPYMGLVVGPISPVLASHLPRTLPHGQGLVVTQVEKDSPAAKGGLKVHDILMCYGDQKLFSAVQLVGLVRQDKGGHEVSLSIVREGKPMTVKVSLGTHAAGQAQAEYENAGPESREFPMPGRFAPGGRQSSSRDRAASPEPQSSRPQEWESFDSMTLQKRGNDSFHVEVQYLNKSGSLDHKTFDGSRAEIDKDILAQKDLPAEERGQLLRSLDLPIAEARTTGTFARARVSTTLGRRVSAAGVLIDSISTEMWTISEFWHAVAGSRLPALKKSLRRAVEVEDYLEAARLRDTIRSIEQRLGKSGGVSPRYSQVSKGRLSTHVESLEKR